VKNSALYLYALPGALILLASPLFAQLTDNNITPNPAKAGIARSLVNEIGGGRGDGVTFGNTSLYIISHDPFRAIRRGRQLFQRRFTQEQGQGPSTQSFMVGGATLNAGIVPNGLTISQLPEIGVGLSDSCASCHGRPRGSAGASGDTFKRPDSRDSPHLFGLGLKEMLGDEITQDLRAIRATAVNTAKSTGNGVTLPLMSKGINYGSITAHKDGTLDTSNVQGVNPDLRVRPIFADGGLFSIRESILATFKLELGIEAVDPDLTAVHNGQKVTTPSGLVLDPAQDTFLPIAPAAAGTDPDRDGVTDEFPASLVDVEEFYLLNYFRPGTYLPDNNSGDGNDGRGTHPGLKHMQQIGCTGCHIQNLPINRDRRSADVSVQYDAVNGGFNHLFATAVPLLPITLPVVQSNNPPVLTPNGNPFLVENIFTDMRRHDLGPNFWERQFDGTLETQFMTLPLWGVGSTSPYGHDGRSINLNEVILRHGGEAQDVRDKYAQLGAGAQSQILDFLNSLILFPPDDTPSNLDPIVPNTPNYPQFGHGSIKLGALFTTTLGAE